MVLLDYCSRSGENYGRIQEKLGGCVLGVVLCAGFHRKLRSFPGGKVDPTDESTLHAALRETKEEIGIDADRIEILGKLGPPARSLSGLESGLTW